MVQRMAEGFPGGSRDERLRKAGRLAKFGQPASPALEQLLATSSRSVVQSYAVSVHSRGYGGTYGFEMECTALGVNADDLPWQTMHVSTSSPLNGSCGVKSSVISPPCIFEASLSWHAMHATRDGFSVQELLCEWHVVQLRTSCGKMT